MRISKATIRRLMIAVSLTAVTLALTTHIRAMFRAETDFAMAILFVEGIGGLILLGIGLAIGGAIRSVRRNDAYADRLRRTDVPARCPLPFAELDSMNDSCDEG